MDRENVLKNMFIEKYGKYSYDENFILDIKETDEAVHSIELACNMYNYIIAINSVLENFEDIEKQYWTNFHFVNRTDFITADQVGLFVDPIFQDIRANFISWK